MKALKVLVMSICAVVATVACSKKGGGTAAAPAVTYYMSNNTCYDAKTNQTTSYSNCNNLTYYFSGSSCIDKNNRNSVDMAHCYALVGQYFYMNGSCYDKNVNGWSNNTNCSNYSNGSRYQWRNNQCIDTQTGWSVQDISLCNNNGTNNGDDPRCLERNRYIYEDYRGRTYYADCYATNCSGLMFYDLKTRNYVTCQ